MINHINTVQLNVKDFLPHKLKAACLQMLQTIHQPIISDEDVMHGADSKRNKRSSLRQVIPYRLLSMADAASCGYEAWHQLQHQYFSGSVDRQYANLKYILSLSQGNHKLSTSEMLKVKESVKHSDSDFRHIQTVASSFMCASDNGKMSQISVTWEVTLVLTHCHLAQG
eukprot:3011250-Amphidinium_carterae.1